MIPYYGYARQDRKVKPRVPITAKLVADLISTAGADRVLCMDLHAGQIQGFFNIPVDNLFATPVLLRAVRQHATGARRHRHLAGRGGRRARPRLRQAAGRLLAIIDKRREQANVAQVMNIIGDVSGTRLRDGGRHGRHRRDPQRRRARPDRRRARAAVTPP